MTETTAKITAQKTYFDGQYISPENVARAAQIGGKKYMVVKAKAGGRLHALEVIGNRADTANYPDGQYSDMFHHHPIHPAYLDLARINGMTDAFVITDSAGNESWGFKKGHETHHHDAATAVRAAVIGWTTPFVITRQQKWLDAVQASPRPSASPAAAAAAEQAKLAARFQTEAADAAVSAVDKKPHGHFTGAAKIHEHVSAAIDGLTKLYAASKKEPERTLAANWTQHHAGMTNTGTVRHPHQITPAAPAAPAEQPAGEAEQEEAE